jgi:diguanylate cyclase (GGDEF)-like protein
MSAPRPPLHVVRMPSADPKADNSDTQLGALVHAAHASQSTTPSGAFGRLTESEAVDILRAIGAGEVDAFVVDDSAGEQQIFTLTSADRPYRMFVENMRDGAATMSSDGIILYANRRLAQLLSLPPEVIVGLPLAAFIVDDAPSSPKELLGAGALGATLEVELRGGGRPVAVLAGSSPLEIDGDQLICVTFADLSVHKEQEREIARLAQGQANRLSELQAAQEALTWQATHDPLTGLPNRGLLVDRVDQALARSKRASQLVAVLFLDLDGFKQVNDTQGHSAGDDVLRNVAASLVGTLRAVDTVARIGGDEFIVLAPDLTSAADAGELAARLLTVLDRISISASVGMALTDGTGATAEALLAEADAAMYHAKSVGGRRIEVFDEHLERRLQGRTAAQKLLEAALENERVVAYYQPIVDVASGATTGYEALARIQENNGALVAPCTFVPAAEENGLITPLGTRMLDLACGEASRWPTEPAAGRPRSIAINLSARQFESGDLTDVVRTALERTGLDPRRLHLELTETALMDLSPGFLRQLEQLRDLGAQVGLDDFGTGYASLTHLRRLPLDFVKIDRSFVAGLGGDGDDDRIVGAVIDLAASLTLRSIAEGVETPDQLRRLQVMGCDQAQGYLFARPLPPEQLAIAVPRRES